MYTCATCSGEACANSNSPSLPLNCPMRDPDNIKNILAMYRSPHDKEIFETATAIEALGYCRWPRLRETAEFCQRMKYRKIGVAFCKGLHMEARVVSSVMEEFGLEVVSVICKAGGIAKEQMGIAPEFRLRPDSFEPMCNPIAQAELLNQQYTEMNVAIGMCVGHDSLFYKHSNAPVTTLIAKDRVLAHNPAAAVYTRDTYSKTILTPGGEILPPQ